MNFSEREHLVNKIVSGCTICDFQGKPVLVYEATPQQKVQAHALYAHEYRRAKMQGVQTDEEIVALMEKRGLWDKLRQSELKTIPKRLEQLKVELYDAFFRFRRRDQIKNQLDSLRLREVQLSTERDKLRHTTCEGYAMAAKNRFLICSSTFDLSNNKVFDDYYELHTQPDLDVFIQSYFDEKVSDDQIREISKEEPWRSIWSAGKNEGAIFGKPASLLTHEQRLLIIWSKIYDSVYESPECPPEEVIDDDDCFDGWLITQNKKRENERKAGHGYKPGDKFGKADEVFIPADTSEDAARIHGMNSPEAIIRKQQRMNALTKSGGVIQEQHMPDSLGRIREAAMQLQRKAIGARNGK